MYKLLFNKILLLIEQGFFLLYCNKIGFDEIIEEREKKVMIKLVPFPD